MSLNSGSVPALPDSRAPRTNAAASGVPRMPVTPDYPNPDQTPVPRQEFFRQHLLAAHLFAQEARAIEALEDCVHDDEAIERHRAFVVGAIMMAAAFVEASINEFHRDLVERLPDGAIALRRQPRLPRPAWGERPRALRHYQVALILADAERFDESRAPYRDVELLLILRDLLSHGFEPRVADQARRLVEDRLRSAFDENCLAPTGARWFPERCLGAGCTAWAVRVAEAFSDEFCRRMSIPARGLGPREWAR